MLSRIFRGAARAGSTVVAPPPISLFQQLHDLCKDESLVEIYVGSEGQWSGLNSDRSRIVFPLKHNISDILDFLSELASSSSTRLDPYRPYAGGVVAGLNWRWHAVTPPMSPDGPILVLRRQQFSDLTLDDFMLENFERSQIAEWLAGSFSLVIFGATGSGKTSFLVSILRELFLDCRLGLAESVQEIPLLSPNWFRLIETSKDTGGRGGVDFERVVAEMMRLSPQALVIGELRGGEARFLPEFARTGHGGVVTTLHAGSSSQAKTRLANLAGDLVENMPPMIGLNVRRDQANEFKVKFSHLN